MSNPSDYSASVLARLLNHSRSHRENYQSLLIRYVIERFLYRLGQSEYRNSYVLKGALANYYQFPIKQNQLSLDSNQCIISNYSTKGQFSSKLIEPEESLQVLGSWRVEIRGDLI